MSRTHVRLVVATSLALATSLGAQTPASKPPAPATQKPAMAPQMPGVNPALLAGGQRERRHGDEQHDLQAHECLRR